MTVAPDAQSYVEMKIRIDFFIYCALAIAVVWSAFVSVVFYRIGFWRGKYEHLREFSDEIAADE